MNTVSMQLYAKERIASARAAADVQRQLHSANEDKNPPQRPIPRRAVNAQTILKLAADWLRRSILFRPG